MKLLVIGGTVFVGRAVVADALRRGAEVTVFHRGHNNPGLFPEAETIIGDRTRDLDRLAGRRWDVVVDTCGFEPEHVAASARALSPVVERYVFVSSGSVYRDWPARPAGDGAQLHDSSESSYGPLKAACERAVDAAMPGRGLHVRAGVIVGPHENIGRLPYWLRRCARGGQVLCPGPPQAPIQLIDVRDLAAWMLEMASAGAAGGYTAVAPPGWETFGRLVELCAQVTGGDCTLAWVDGDRVAAALDDPWTQLPLWPPPLEETRAIYEMRADQARATGLVPRPLAETVADTWEWLRAEPGSLGEWRREVQARGLEPEREAALLRELA